MALTPPPVAPPAAPPLPGEAPSRANPSTFRALADAFVVWQVGFRDWLAGMVAWLAGYISWASTNVTEMDALQSDVTGKSSAATTAASSATASAAAVQANRTALDNRLYPGTYSADPVTRPDGSAVQAGDRYFNSSIARQKTYSGTVWATDNLDSAALAAPGGSSLVGFTQPAAGTSPGTVAVKLGAQVSVKDAPFNAKGDGVTNDTAAIQAAIDFCVTNRRELVFDIGDYLISATLTINLPDRGSLTMRGKGTAGARYKEPQGMVGARLIATGAGWVDDQPMLTSNLPATWFRTTVSLHNLSFVGDNSTLDGTDTAKVVGYYAHVNSYVRECGFYLCKYGVRHDGGYSQFHESVFAKCSHIGLYMEKGDTQVSDCNFDDIRRDADDGRTVAQGSGIYVWKGSNINITGGKIEQCQKGIQLYRAQGINISGINFDYCRYTVCGLSENSAEEAYAIRSVNIAHCRFLASITKHIVFENNTTFQNTIAITGCSFARGNSGAYDNNTVGLQPDGTYPANNFLDFRGSGSFDVVFVGNNTLLAATSVSVFFPAKGTLNLTGNSDAFITVDLSGGDGKVVRRPREFVMAAVPATGVWKQGDLVHIQFPGAGHAESYSCVLAGDFAGVAPQFQPTGILGAVKAEPATDIATLLVSLRNAGILKP